MLRTESLEEITDGKKYKIGDIVKAGTGGCSGCSYCCETMADTIVLSPYDVWNLECGTGMSFDNMIDTILELKIHDGIILPNMKSINGACVMLEKGRCSVHKNRPDFCRLFPLGRLYEGDEFSYIMQKGQCEKASVKVKIKKWIDCDNYEAYSEYITKWHGIIRMTEEKAYNPNMDGSAKKDMLTTLLMLFFQRSYKGKDFYYEFNVRAEQYMNKMPEWK